MRPWIHSRVMPTARGRTPSSRTVERAYLNPPHRAPSCNPPTRAHLGPCDTSKTVTRTVDLLRLTGRYFGFTLASTGVVGWRSPVQNHYGSSSLTPARRAG